MSYPLLLKSNRLTRLGEPTASSCRLLRSVKNRFGPSNEIGVFQMEAGGLDDVADPSMLFLSTKHADGDGGDEVDQKGPSLCGQVLSACLLACRLPDWLALSSYQLGRLLRYNAPPTRLVLEPPRPACMPACFLAHVIETPGKALRLRLCGGYSSDLIP